MTSPIRPGQSPFIAEGPQPLFEQAAAQLRRASQAGAPDLRCVGQAIIDIAEQEPTRAAALLDAMRQQLSSADADELARGVAQSADSRATQLKASSPRAFALMLDMAQLGLSIAGIFDPTPTCDAIDGVISVLRGDYKGAAISAVGMIPYLGDAAKLGKLGKLAGVVSETAELVKHDPGFAAHAGRHAAQAREALAAVDLRRSAGSWVEHARAMDRQLDAINPAPLADARQALRELRAERRLASGAGAGERRLVELRSDRPTQVVSAVDLVVEDMLGEMAARSRLDAMVDSLRRTAGAPELTRALPQSGPGLPTPALQLIPESAMARAVSHPERIVFRNADDMLTHFGLRRIASHEPHLDIWRSAHAALTAPDRLNAYSRAMDTLAAGGQLSPGEARQAFNSIRREFATRFEQRFDHRPADVEHVINLAICPNLALHPHNLAVTRRECELGTKQHELLHWIKSGGDTHGDPRAWWMQIYADSSGRFAEMSPRDVEQAVAELPGLLVPGATPGSQD